MKVTPINGLGSYGVYIDDIDMDHMTLDQWNEIGKIFIQELVVVMRNIKITKAQYVDWIQKWGIFKNDISPKLIKKYGTVPDSLDPSTWDNLSDEDRRWVSYRQHMLEETGDGRYIVRIHPGRTADGKPTGYFSEGDLGWHNNESSSLTFTPCVSLLGWEDMNNSATCFVQSVDAYENLPSGIRSEIEDMVTVHKFEPGRVNQREVDDHDLAEQLRWHFCPQDGVETPLVCTGTNNRKGLHYCMNTRYGIKGTSQQESQKIFNMLDRIFMDEKYIYDHWYSDQGNTLCLFDNSVTMHRRIGGHGNRKAFRCQFDPSPLLDHPYAPWQNSPTYHRQYVDLMHEFVNTMGGKYPERVKIPVLS